MLPAPTHPTPRRGSSRPNSALTRNPASGTRSTRGARMSIAPLLLHQVELVDIHLPAGPVDLHDDGDPDHHLRCGDGDHEEGENDAVERVEVAAHGGERQ